MTSEDYFERGDFPWPDSWPLADRRGLTQRRSKLRAEVKAKWARWQKLVDAEDKRSLSAQDEIDKLRGAVPELSDRPPLGAFLEAKLADAVLVVACVEDCLAAAKASVQQAELIAAITELDVQIAHIDRLTETGPGAVGNEEQLQIEAIDAQLSATKVWVAKAEKEAAQRQLALARERQRQISAQLATVRRRGAAGQLPADEPLQDPLHNP